MNIIYRLINNKIKFIKKQKFCLIYLFDLIKLKNWTILNIKSIL
jgi:hypothetical protein